jgi:glycosyltransferase involved in cell wall biosynthesis
VIPNGFDCDRFRPDPLRRQEFRRELGIPQDAPVVGIVARDHPNKDLSTFIAAATIVADQVPRAHFVMCGTGMTSPGATWMSVASAQLAGRLHRTEARADVEGVYNALDVFALTSASESFPNALGEAMASGVPCVTTAVGDAALVVGDTGRVAPARDPATVANAIVALLVESAAQHELRSGAARDRIVALYPIEQAAKRYERLYESVTETHAV